jgi:hypothetical protein
MSSGLAIKLERLSLCFLFFSMSILADVVSTSGNIFFSHSVDGPNVAALTSRGFSIGSDTQPSSNLQVSGNAIISASLSIGSVSLGSSNLSLAGTFSQSYITLSDNTSIDSHSIVMADCSGGNLVLSLPNAYEIGNGRIVDIKKITSENDLAIVGGVIDDGAGIFLPSGSLGHLRVISASGSWYILSMSGNGQLWTPIQINTIAWYDPTDSNSLDETSYEVRQINDKSGNDYHMIQDSASRKPTTGSRRINSLNVLDGDGGDYMSTTSLASFPGDLSVFIVAEIDDPTNTNAGIFATASSGNQIDFYSQNSSNWNGRLRIEENGGSTIYSDTFTGAPHLGPSIYNPTWSNSSNIMYGYLDGVKLTSNEDISTKLIDTTDVTMALFTKVANFAQQPDGALGETIIVSDLTEATRQRIEGYLAHKWGLANNLEATHPYRHFPPH